MRTLLVLLVICLLLPVPVTLAVTIEGGPVRSDTEPNPAAKTSQTVIKTVLADKIENNTVYTSEGTYNIANAHVMDRAKGVPLGEGKKRMVQLTIIDGIVTEVIIRP